MIAESRLDGGGRRYKGPKVVLVIDGFDKLSVDWTGEYGCPSSGA